MAQPHSNKLTGKKNETRDRAVWLLGLITASVVGGKIFGQGRFGAVVGRTFKVAGAGASVGLVASLIEQVDTPHEKMYACVSKYTTNCALWAGGVTYVTNLIAAVVRW